MIRSPSGRAHFRTKAEFDREMERIEVEVRGEGAARLDIDVVFARAGFYETANGAFTDVETGASVSLLNVGENHAC